MILEKRIRLGKVLKQQRDANGITQTTFCGATKMHHTILKRVETGADNYTIDTLLLYLMNIGAISKTNKKRINDILTT